MNIWRPAPSKLSQLKQNNPGYWNILLGRSQYSEAEIVATLAEIETVNAEWHALQVEVCANTLTDKHGPMGSKEGYASDGHREIHDAIINGNGYVSASYSDNGHLNCLPVRKWQKDAARTRREIAKIRKMVEAL